MDGDSGQKTEQPTPKKRRDAREKGQVAQSKELTILTGMITLIGVLLYNFNSNYILLAKNHAYIMSMISQPLLDAATISTGLKNVVNTVLKITLPPVIAAAIVSGMVNILQLGGIILSKDFLKIDFTKLHPVKNFQSIFSVKNFTKFCRQFGEMTVMACVTYVIVRKQIAQIGSLYNYDLESIIIFTSSLIGRIFIYLLFIHIICSMFDLFLERRNLTKQLMMSMSELKQEYRSTEGNPEVKSRRKELHRELVEGDGMDEMLAQSSLVLANPTHIAIVVLYRPLKWKLPIILAKAKGERAQMIFQLAKKLDVPIIREKWLARQLFALAEIGKYVPSSLLSHVADLIGRNLHLLPKLTAEMAQANAEANLAKPPLFKANGSSSA